MSDDDDLSHEGHWRNRNGFNGRIMFSAVFALFFVVILVVLLHLYARCILRRQARRRAVLRQLNVGMVAAQTHIQLPKKGLDASVIDALPLFAYKKSGEVDCPVVECAVCLSGLEEGEMARLLPNCNHMFHEQCIDMWLNSNSTCPICRTGAEPKAGDGEGVAGADPSAPPMEAMSRTASVAVEGTSDGVGQSSKVVGSSSRLGSFKRMLSFSKDRSEERRMQSFEDLERQ